MTCEANAIINMMADRTHLGTLMINAYTYGPEMLLDHGALTIRDNRVVAYKEFQPHEVRPLWHRTIQRHVRDFNKLWVSTYLCPTKGFFLNRLSDLVEALEVHWKFHEKQGQKIREVLESGREGTPFCQALTNKFINKIREAAVLLFDGKQKYESEIFQELWDVFKEDLDALMDVRAKVDAARIWNMVSSGQDTLLPLLMNTLRSFHNRALEENHRTPSVFTGSAYGFKQYLWATPLPLPSVTITSDGLWRRLSLTPKILEDHRIEEAAAIMGYFPDMLAEPSISRIIQAWTEGHGEPGEIPSLIDTFTENFTRIAVQRQTFEQFQVSEINESAFLGVASAQSETIASGFGPTRRGGTRPWRRAAETGSTFVDEGVPWWSDGYGTLSNSALLALMAVGFTVGSQITFGVWPWELALKT